MGHLPRPLSEWRVIRVPQISRDFVSTEGQERSKQEIDAPIRKSESSPPFGVAFWNSDRGNSNVISAFPPLVSVSESTSAPVWLLLCILPSMLGQFAVSHKSHSVRLGYGHYHSLPHDVHSKGELPGYWKGSQSLDIDSAHCQPRQLQSPRSFKREILLLRSRMHVLS